MTDKMLSVAVARRDKLRKELAEVEGFIRQYGVLFGGNTPEDQVFPEAQGALKAPATTQTLRKRVSGNSHKEEVAYFAREIIKGSGAPVPLRTLYRELIKLGLLIDGKDPHSVLQVMLQRMPDQIRRVGKRGSSRYILAEHAEAFEK